MFLELEVRWLKGEDDLSPESEDKFEVAKLFMPLSASMRTRINRETAPVLEPVPYFGSFGSLSVEYDEYENRGLRIKLDNGETIGGPGATAVRFRAAETDFLACLNDTWGNPPSPKPKPATGPKTPKGSVFISSSPPGARVYDGRKRLGSTPLRIEGDVGRQLDLHVQLLGGSGTWSNTVSITKHQLHQTVFVRF